MSDSRLIPPVTPTPVTSAKPKEPRWPYLVILALFMCALGLLWVAVTSTREVPPQPPPPTFTLRSKTVPLGKQVVVLVDMARSDQVMYQLVQDVLLREVVNLQPDERLCLMAVGPDNPLITPTPWCSQQERVVWWELPYAPPQDSPQSVVLAYTQALPGLQAELDVNRGRAEAAWDSKRAELVDSMYRFLWQSSPPEYLDIKGSLATLLKATKAGGTRDAHTHLILFSWMNEVPYGDWVGSPELIPASPGELKDAEVTVNLFSVTGGEELVTLKAKWDPWFLEGSPQSLDWRVLAVPVEQVPVVSKRKRGGHQLPPVVKKPPFPQDFTNVIRGEVADGDVTSVTR